MKKGAIWILLTSLMVMSVVLASCSTSTQISTSKSASITTPTTTATSTIAQTTVKTTTPTSKTTTSGKWWDSLGVPQYGGTMILRYKVNIASFDPYVAIGGATILSAWLERLHGDDWTLDPSAFGYKINWRPPDFEVGLLAQSYEFTDPSTYVVHLRQGIHWQDIPPANGREFTADDVVFHYDRMLGLGDGYTKPSANQIGTSFMDLDSVTATDKYTVVFKWKKSNPEYILEAIQSLNTTNCLVNPEAVKFWGDVNDWHHSIGTGPFILNDYVSGSSATMVKNPNYWQYDERYPQNKLPYVDILKILIIIDPATTLAALRTGKIDAIDQFSLSQAQSVEKTNPEILQLPTPMPYGVTVDPRNDKAPFTDIRVREAMQMALDLPTIAKSYYGGNADPSPVALTSSLMTGWGFSYDKWPQDLKDQYAYNPTAAKKLLADAGYPGGFKTDIVADTAGDMDLLQIVKAYFAVIGIDMEIRPLDSASFTAFVYVGFKQDQLAFRSTGIMGLTIEPFRQLSNFQTGSASNIDMVSDPAYDDLCNKALATTSVDGMKQVMKDVNERVARQHYTISLLQPNLFALYQPWFKGYIGQYQSISGGTAGILLLSGGPAHFWIDQNLKKSMGY